MLIVEPLAKMPIRLTFMFHSELMSLLLRYLKYLLEQVPDLEEFLSSELNQADLGYEFYSFLLLLFCQGDTLPSTSIHNYEYFRKVEKK